MLCALYLHTCNPALALHVLRTENIFNLCVPKHKIIAEVGNLNPLLLVATTEIRERGRECFRRIGGGGFVHTYKS